MTRNDRQLATLARFGVLAVVAPAPAQYYWGGRHYYNPYTGGRAAAHATHNSLTGGHSHTASGYNPYTGRDYRSATYYNPLTGTVDRTRAFYNPYTGRYGYRSGVRRR